MSFLSQEERLGELTAYFSDLLGSLKEQEDKGISAKFHQVQQVLYPTLRVKGAPLIRDWYVVREAAVTETCDLLGIGRSNSECFEPARMVGLAGASGAGKSTVASMLVAREDVQAWFDNRILWLRVGDVAKNDLPAFMLDLADMVYKEVLQSTGRPPRRGNVLMTSEHGAAYIRAMVHESRWLLIVADDVCGAEVLRELKKAGAWVLYTTRHHNLLPGTPSLQLDKILNKEADMLLRRAADLGDNAPLPEAAYVLMEHCEFAAFDLALVGRWDVVRVKNDEKAWQAALDRIVEAQRGGEGGQPLPFRSAVLRAGLGVLACSPQNRDLYLALGILPKGLDFPAEVAGGLPHGNDSSAEDLGAAKNVLEALVRLSILAVDDRDWYRLHDIQADFARDCLAADQETRDRVLPRWREFISNVNTLLAFSSAWLTTIWDALAEVEGKRDISKAHDAAVNSVDPSSSELARPYVAKLAKMNDLDKRFRQTAKAVADFQEAQKDWEGMNTTLHRVVEVEKIGLTDPDMYTFDTFRRLADCAERLGNAEEAVEWHEKELEGLSSALALAVLTDGDSEEQVLRRSLEIHKAKLGRDHGRVVNTLYELAANACGALSVRYRHAGRLEEAETFLRNCLEFQESKPGAEGVLASTLHELGVCVREAERLEEAEELLRRCLGINEAKLGPENAQVACTLHELAVCIQQAGQLEEAGRLEERENMIKRFLGTKKARLERVYMQVAFTLQHLGVCVQEKGRLEEARGFLRRSLEIQIDKLDRQGEQVVSTMTQLGLLMLETGGLEEAEESLRRCLKIQTAKRGPEDEQVVDILNQLGICVRKAGRMEEAANLFTRCLNFQEAELGPENEQVASTLHQLGVCIREAGRLEEAEELLRRCLQIQTAKLGPAHDQVASTLQELGLLLRQAGRTEEAEELSRRWTAMRTPMECAKEELFLDRSIRVRKIQQIAGFLAKMEGKDPQVLEMGGLALCRSTLLILDGKTKLSSLLEPLHGTCGYTAWFVGNTRSGRDASTYCITLTER